MGVLGLGPFIQKTCPQVIKRLPDRLQGISGKRIVIDGTLITQRLHFAQSPFKYRHVLGWYRIIKELEESGVSAVCVFDGQERSFAKAREVERRRASRRLATTRGILEGDRLKRLKKLRTIVHCLDSLDDASRQRTTDILKQMDLGIENLVQEISLPSQIDAVSQLLLQESSGAPYQDPTLVLDEAPDTNIDSLLSGKASATEQALSAEEHSTVEQPLYPEQPATVERPSPVEQPSTEQPLAAEEPSTIEELATAGQPLTPESLSTVEQPPHEESLMLPTPIPIQLNVQDQDFPSPVSREPYVDLDSITLGVDEIPPALASLYADYKNSIAQLSSLFSVHVPSPTISTPSLVSPDLEDTQVDQVMTKAQHQLTQEEGKLWCMIYSIHGSSISDPPHEVLSETPEKIIDKLAERSSVMSESFHRRTNVATLQTYQESLEILRAMGVPCIEATGTYEAEAVASSFVLNGHADYVASEDTDVLVYEAPLIRNLTNRQDPLTIVSGSDVRQSLGLDRDSYVDFALLLGTDFSQRIKNVGPLRAYKFIKEYGSIERIIHAEKKYVPRLPTPAYLEQVTIARKIFRTLPPVTEKDLLALQDAVKDDVELAQIMQRYGLGRALMADDNWDHGAALVGNYFGDDPSAGNYLGDHQGAAAETVSVYF